MKEILWTTPTTKVEYVRDAHLDSFWIAETEFVDPILERNKRIRLEGLMPQGKKTSLLDGEIAFAFSIPPNQFGRLKDDYPEIWALLQSDDKEDNLKGGQKLALLHPEWCVTEANR